MYKFIHSLHNLADHFCISICWCKIKFKLNIAQHTKSCNCIKLQLNRTFDRLAQHSHDENLKMIDIVESVNTYFLPHIHIYILLISLSVYRAHRPDAFYRRSSDLREN